MLKVRQIEEASFRYHEYLRKIALDGFSFLDSHVVENCCVVHQGKKARISLTALVIEDVLYPACEKSSMLEYTSGSKIFHRLLPFSTCLIATTSAKRAHSFSVRISLPSCPSVRGVKWSFLAGGRGAEISRLKHLWSNACRNWIAHYYSSTG
jgi:hypothetical protein